MARKRTRPNFELEPPSSFTRDPMSFYGIQLDEKQLEYANSIWSSDYDIIFVNAKAGTGKTTVAVGVADMLHGWNYFSNVVYIMSPYGESKQGYLPGTQTEKSSVYFEALYQALIAIGLNPQEVICDESMVNQKYGTGYITAITDTYLRGSNLDDAVVIVDEAQNFTFDQLKTVLTRIGKKVKVVVIGHDKQCDLKDKASSGFTKYIEHFSKQERCCVCELTENHRSWISQWADEAKRD
jgi:phosphate starvation-inducible protein PhoH